MPPQFDMVIGDMAVPANVTQYGDQTYEFGLPEDILTVIGGMAITQVKPKYTPEFQKEAMGGKGQTVAVAQCKTDKVTYSCSGYLLDKTAFLGVRSFSYDGRFHVVGPRNPAYESGEFQKCDFESESWPLIAAPAGGA